MRLWASSTLTLSAAAAMGIALGSYSVSPQRSPVDEETLLSPYAETASDVQSAVMAEPAAGPAVIRCTGCGPTLADRMYARDTAGLDADGMVSGSDDPLVQDYLARGQVEERIADAALPPPPSPTYLSPVIERFAHAESAAAAPRPAASAGASATPPPVAVTTPR